MSNKSTKTILEEALVCIQKGFVQGINAVNTQGKECSILSDKAVAWCLVGALHVPTRNKYRQDVHDAVYKALDMIGWKGCLVPWEMVPGRTQKDCILLLELAIRLIY